MGLYRTNSDKGREIMYRLDTTNLERKAAKKAAAGREQDGIF